MPLTWPITPLCHWPMSAIQPTREEPSSPSGWQLWRKRRNSWRKSCQPSAGIWRLTTRYSPLTTRDPRSHSYSPVRVLNMRTWGGRCTKRSQFFVQAWTGVYPSWRKTWGSHYSQLSIRKRAAIVTANRVPTGCRQGAENLGKPRQTSASQQQRIN